MFGPLGLALLAPLVTAAPAAPAAPAALSELPVDVVAPTPTEAIGVDELYAVRGGKLWVKPATKEAAATVGGAGTGGAVGTWALYGGTGLVPGSTHAIVAVFADETDMFTVMTDDGLLHHHEGTSPGWDSLWGLPQLPSSMRGALALPLASAAKAPTAGRVAYSMRHKNVLYYEDRLGAQFNWGTAGCTSLFVLADDRRRILFGDPWLPPDFSREVCAPERGGLEMAALAASASLLFVIGTDGSLYTRFDDYDHNGGTPLISYEYRADKSAKAPKDGGLPGTELLSGFQTHFLPGFDWEAQPAIALEGRARLSTHIAVLQTGQGNRSRKLRVIGDDKDGRRGVYEKMLDDKAWTFRAIDARAASVVGRDPASRIDGAGVAGADVADVADGEWIDPHAHAHHAGPRASYSGFLRPDGDRALPRVFASTDDFAFHCSPFHMALQVDGVDVKLLVHAVDAWTLYTEQNPVDDDIATKRYKLTFFVEDKAHLDAATLAKLDTIFRGDLEKAFAFIAMANQHEIVVQPVSYPLDGARARWSMVLRADPRTRSAAFVQLHPATKLARTVVDVAASRSASRCTNDAALRTQAADALAKVRALREQWQGRLQASAAMEAFVPAGTAAVDVATVLTTTRFTVPYVSGLDSVELNLPAVLGAPALSYSRLLDSSRADFDDVEKALQQCVARAPR